VADWWVSVFAAPSALLETAACLAVVYCGASREQALMLKRMNLLKKNFAFDEAFGYISAPRQT